MSSSHVVPCDCDLAVGDQAGRERRGREPGREGGEGWMNGWMDEGREVGGEEEGRNLMILERTTCCRVALTQSSRPHEV